MQMYVDPVSGSGDPPPDLPGLIHGTIHETVHVLIKAVLDAYDHPVEIQQDRNGECDVDR